MSNQNNKRAQKFHEFWPNESTASLSYAYKLDILSSETNIQISVEEGLTTNNLSTNEGVVVICSLLM